MPTDTDVLIVGAGPVGLFLANECARRGLRFRIIEERSAQSDHSKALAIFPRTFEIFDMAGLAPPFSEVANRVTWVAVASHERQLARLHFAPEGTPYPYVAMVPQDVTERLLAEALKQKGGLIEYDTKCVNIEQQRDHVVVMADRKGQPVTITAAYIVGCDGAHSVVRHRLNLSFEGGSYDATYMLADIDTNDALPGDEMQLCPNALGPVAIFPMSATRRRVVAMMVAPPTEDAPSMETVRQVLAQRAPAALEARGLRWSAYFRIHHRQVEQMRVGRVFVAGDAAHIHSPFGGQGMNTGLQDAWNLAWKLDFAVRGHATELLLDSYAAERRPVIKQVIDLTHFMTTALGAPNKIAQALRDAIIPIVWHLPPFEHFFVERLSELGVAYRGSPIVDGGGQRYFDDSLRGGNGIKSRFLLMAFDRGDGEPVAASFPDLVEVRETRRPGLTLVRPDGYVAATAVDSAQRTLSASLRSPT
jgi:2-polyprenyl-6-methoxyphenol hydroxylase-like FAD-dependent oxidoreductase